MRKGYFRRKAILAAQKSFRGIRPYGVRLKEKPRREAGAEENRMNSV